MSSAESIASSSYLACAKIKKGMDGKFVVFVDQNGEPWIIICAHKKDATARVIKDYKSLLSEKGLKPKKKAAGKVENGNILIPQKIESLAEGKAGVAKEIYMALKKKKAWAKLAKKLSFMMSDTEPSTSEDVRAEDGEMSDEEAVEILREAAINLKDEEARELLEKKKKITKTLKALPELKSISPQMPITIDALLSIPGKSSAKVNNGVTSNAPQPPVQKKLDLGALFGGSRDALAKKNVPLGWSDKLSDELPELESLKSMARRHIHGKQGHIVFMKNKDNKEVVCKIERDEAEGSLKHEYEAFKKLARLGDVRGLPKVYGMAGIHWGEYRRQALVMEQVDGQVGTVALNNLRRKYEAGKISHDQFWSAIASVARQLITLQAKLEAAGIQHNDIKPENIVIKPDGTVVLIDFGLFSNEGEDAPGTTLTYAPKEYQPDELKKKKKKKKKKSDEDDDSSNDEEESELDLVDLKIKGSMEAQIFMIGATVLGSATGLGQKTSHQPKDGLQVDPKQNPQKTQEGVVFNQSDWASFLQAAMDPDPKKRKSPAQLLEEPFLKQTDPELGESVLRDVQKADKEPEVVAPAEVNSLITAMRNLIGDVIDADDITTGLQLLIKAEALLSKYDGGIEPTKLDPLRDTLQELEDCLKKGVQPPDLYYGRNEDKWPEKVNSILGVCEPLNISKLSKKDKKRLLKSRANVLNGLERMWNLVHAENVKLEPRGAKVKHIDSDLMKKLMERYQNYIDALKVLHYEKDQKTPRKISLTPNEAGLVQVAWQIIQNYQSTLNGTQSKHLTISRQVEADIHDLIGKVRMSRDTLKSYIQRYKEWGLPVHPDLESVFNALNATITSCDKRLARLDQSKTALAKDINDRINNVWAVFIARAIDLSKDMRPNLKQEEREQGALKAKLMSTKVDMTAWDLILKYTHVVEKELGKGPTGNAALDAARDKLAEVVRTVAAVRFVDKFFFADEQIEAESEIKPAQVRKKLTALLPKIKIRAKQRKELMEVQDLSTALKNAIAYSVSMVPNDLAGAYGLILKPENEELAQEHVINTTISLKAEQPST